MPEPTDPFSHFDPEVSMPLSAADVRRRGDRLRRRNAALAVAGAVAAIILVATPFVVLGGDDDTGALVPTDQRSTVVDPAPTTSLSEDTVTSRAPLPSELVTATIPDDFPLAVGLPDTNEDGSSVEVVETSRIEAFTCGEPLAISDGATDLAEARFSQPEDTRYRGLAVFPSDAAARTHLDAVRAAHRACAEDSPGQLWTEQPSSFVADDSSVFTVLYSAFGPEEPFAPSVGLSVEEVVRVGNALLTISHSSEGGGSDDAASKGARRTAQEAAEVVAELRAVFGDAEPGGGAPEPTLLGVAALPDRDRLGAWAEDPNDAITFACGSSSLFADLQAEGSVAVRYAASGTDDEGGPTIGRVRTAVLQFATGDDGAARAYDALQDNLAFCAEEDDRITDLDIGTYLPDIGDDATWSGFSYGATDVCTDCDATWFDRMGVARVGDRVVVVSYAEVGGPLQPPGLNQALVTVLERAAELA